MKFLLLFSLSVFMICARGQDQDKSLQWADSTLQYFDEAPNVSNDRASWLTDSIIALYTMYGKPCARLHAQSANSEYLRGSGNYDKALARALEVLQLHQAGCDSGIYKSTLLVITGIFHDLQDPKKVDSASAYAMKYINPGDGKIYLDLIMLRGIGRFMAGDEDGSRQYFQKAVQLSSSNSDYPHTHIKALTMMGTFYTFLYQNHLGQPLAEDYRDSSLKYERMALEKARYQHDSAYMASIYNAMAFLSDDLDKRSELVDSAISIATKNHNVADLPTYIKNRARVLGTNGQYNEAYDVLWQLINLQDSLYNINRLKAIAEVEEQYRDRLEAEENLRLNNELELKEESLEKNRVILALISGGSAVILIVLGLLYISHLRIQKARKSSEQLLLNMLPIETARELKQKGYTTASKFEDATIIFADIEGFTRVSQQMTAEDLVYEIDHYFRSFDEIVYKHGLEKIKSVGDAYIAAAGLPENNTSNAKAAVKAALEMQKCVERIKREHQAMNKAFFEFRCGIHSGPVVAGVVGIRKWQYDIWGDTVNVAARLEQASATGKINISEATYRQVKDYFRCTSRGKIHAKNKGEIEMYFVEGPLT